MIEGYDVAQVCLNGHATNSHSMGMPQFNQDHCDKCGEHTITECPHCQTQIRGYYHIPGVLGIMDYKPPAYCYRCGGPFPWTERRMQAAVELVTEDGGLTEGEVKQFKEAVKDIASDTPRTQVGATRFKRAMTKVGRETASAVRDIVVDIASEAAKKIIWGQ